MKAWTLSSTEDRLRLSEVPPPTLRDGGALLRMLAVQVPSYTRVLTSGGRGGIATPTVLGIGGIGRVEAVADDVHTVRAGDIALCTGFLASGRLDEPEGSSSGGPASAAAAHPPRPPTRCAGSGATGPSPNRR